MLQSYQIWRKTWSQTRLQVSHK